MISLFYPSEKTQWKKLENIIIKLQQRITKAALQGNYRKLRNLERLFLKSHSRQLKLVPQISLEQNFKKKFEFINENGELDQHEGSFIVGKILKEIYIDSALKKAEKIDNLYNQKEETIEPINISWKNWKMTK